MEQLHERLDVTWVCEVTAAGRGTDAEAHSTESSNQAFGVDGLLSALGPMASMSFTVGARVTAEGVAMSCRIGGTGPPTMEGIPDRHHLREIESLRIAMAPNRALYQLTPVVAEEAETRDVHTRRHEATLMPPSVAFGVGDRHRIGFRSDPTYGGRMRILLTPESSAGGLGSFDGVMRVAERYGANLDVTVSFEPRKLSERESHALASALALARRGHGTSDAPPRQSGGNGVLFDERLEAVAQTMEHWLRSGLGYRVVCHVASDQPIDRALLAVLAEVVFPGFHTHPEPVDAGSPDQEHGLGYCEPVDLAGCLPSPLRLAAPLPSAECLNARGITRIHDGPNVPLPASGVLLGTVLGSRGPRPVRVTDDDRMRHFMVTGATGTGKSTLLYSSICQDIRSGHGVVVLDPHGDLFQAVLASIPRERAEDVVVIDVTDQEWAVGLNFLECRSPGRKAQMTFITNELVKILDRLYDLKVTGGPMFETYFRNGLLLIMDSSRTDGTLMDLPRIFEDREFREYLKGLCTNPVVERFWTRQAERAGGEASLPNIAPYITSKLNQFTTNAMVTPIIGQATSTIRFREMMDRRRIVLINLPMGLLGELNTQLLGMLFIGKMYGAAMGRASVPARDRVPCYVYIDEFQLFATSTVAHVLAGARKYGLSLTLANQNLAQLMTGSGRDNLLEATLGNCGSMVCFRLGVSDAEKLEPYMRPELAAQDLQMLPNFHAATRLLAHNVPTRPFVLATLATTFETDAVDAAGLVELSRQLYCRRIDEVEREIRQSGSEAEAAERPEARKALTMMDVMSREEIEAAEAAAKAQQSTTDCPVTDYAAPGVTRSEDEDSREVG